MNLKHSPFAFAESEGVWQVMSVTIREFKTKGQLAYLQFCWRDIDCSFGIILSDNSH